MDLILARIVQIFDISKSVFYIDQISGSEHPLTTLDVVMFAGYYVLDMETMRSTVLPQALQQTVQMEDYLQYENAGSAKPCEGWIDLRR